MLEVYQAPSPYPLPQLIVGEGIQEFSALPNDSCLRTETWLASLSVANSKEILPELLKLPRSERARLARELLGSLDESEEADVAEAWLKELDKRVREVSSGTAKLEGWAATRRRIEARLRSR